MGCGGYQEGTMKDLFFTWVVVDRDKMAKDLQILGGTVIACVPLRQGASISHNHRGVLSRDFPHVLHSRIAQ
jgi:hypothetical protein